MDEHTATYSTGRVCACKYNNMDFFDRRRTNMSLHLCDNVPYKLSCQQVIRNLARSSIHRVGLRKLREPGLRRCSISGVVHYILNLAEVVLMSPPKFRHDVAMRLPSLPAKSARMGWLSLPDGLDYPRNYSE